MTRPKALSPSHDVGLLDHLLMVQKGKQKANFINPSRPYASEAQNFNTLTRHI